MGVTPYETYGASADISGFRNCVPSPALEPNSQINHSQGLGAYLSTLLSLDMQDMHLNILSYSSRTYRPTHSFPYYTESGVKAQESQDETSFNWLASIKLLGSQFCHM